MTMSYNWFKVGLWVLGLFEIWVFIYVLEHIFSRRVKNQYPPVSCRSGHIRALIREIRTHYPNAKVGVDIGAGVGRLARAVSRGTGMYIYGIENMPVSICVARILNFLTGATRVRMIYADAFEYLANYDGRFDIGIAYLGPGMNYMLGPIMSKFRVVITLDVEIPGLTPTRIIDAGGGYTRYHGVGKYPHRLFVYENAGC